MNDATNFSEAAMLKYFEACRGQYESGLALLNALVAGAERMRAMQLAAAHETKAKQAEFARQIAKASSLQDLLILQGALLNEYCLRAVAYWSKLAELSQRTQAEIAAVLRAQGTEALKQAYASAKAPASAPGASESLATVMQSAFAAARGANEAYVNALTRAYPLAPAPKKPAKAATARAT